MCNPAGDWNQGGFNADTGVTGRKIVIDAYGPRVPVGGGAYSGKDPSKVDRSAAYMARHIAR
ncbi:MAG: methionine adenosyltransferase domain-containing protein [Candidatus Dojkabacteria bacterium]